MSKQTLSSATGKVEKITLWPGKAPVGEGKTENANALISIYHPAKPNGTVIIICPGGGYEVLMREPEGYGIAEWLNGHGITGVVLEYRFPKGRPFIPIYDAQRTIRTVRHKHLELKCACDRIGIIGFSAGGHLAATCATLYDFADPGMHDPISSESCRPDFAILIYPVVTMGPGGHIGLNGNLLGKNPKPEIMELFSAEKHINEQTPPAFLAHAVNDQVVPLIHSQMFYDSLRAHNVPTEFLKLPDGGHGLNHYQGPMWEKWQSAALDWLKKQGFSV